MNCPPLLALSSKPHHGDAHWRIGRPWARLREAGVDARICWVDQDELPTEAVVGRVVVLQRVIRGTTEADIRIWADQLRSAGALAIVFELDDDELSGANVEHMDAIEPLTSADRAELERQRQALLWTLQACDGSTVSVEPLAEVVRRYTDKPVIVVPNAIDVEWFRERLDPNPPWSEYLTIGWTGWKRPDADLAPVAEAWARIAKRYPEVRFVVGGHQPDILYAADIPLDRIIRLPVVGIDEYPKLHQTTIGCCSVAPSPFSACKSRIKEYEYALAGAAVVSSEYLYGREIGFSSFSPVGSVTSWAASLTDLLESRHKRENVAARQRRIVKQQHSLTGNLYRWADAYSEIAASVGVRA
jgi:glycosyltransferase involved in cell wall biosynthesis